MFVDPLNIWLPSCNFWGTMTARNLIAGIILGCSQRERQGSLICWEKYKWLLLAESYPGSRTEETDTNLFTHPLSQEGPGHILKRQFPFLEKSGDFHHFLIMMYDCRYTDWARTPEGTAYCIHALVNQHPQFPKAVLANQLHIPFFHFCLRYYTTSSLTLAKCVQKTWNINYLFIVWSLYFQGKNINLLYLSCSTQNFA